MLRHKHFCTQSLFRAGRISEARMEAVTLVKLKPDWSQGYQRLGEALLALQEYEEAEAVHLPYLSLWHECHVVPDVCRKVVYACLSGQKSCVCMFEYVRFGFIETRMCCSIVDTYTSVCPILSYDQRACLFNTTDFCKGVQTSPEQQGNAGLACTVSGADSKSHGKCSISGAFVCWSCQTLQVFFWISSFKTLHA